ncbi:MAG: dTDP-glucose 4,6-dehydratase [Planctomycetota bacterium]
MSTWIVTGGAGFIGANFVKLLLAERPDLRVVVFDALTYAGNPDNLSGLAEAHGDRYAFVRGDVASADDVQRVLSAEQPALIAHLAAESHVDRSIVDASAFLRTNVLGTQVLLDAARAAGVPRMLQVSTDEVYGTLAPDDPPFSETTPLAPNSPYAASKASADLLCRAAFHTHRQDVVITRCSNNYGPLQFPEKLIPLMIVRAMADESLPVYGDGRQVRDWLHVEDHARALLAVAERGQPGEVYNIGGNCERANIDVVRGVLAHLGKPDSLIRHVTDRPGHDRRYAINASRMQRELGWTPTRTFEDGLAETIEWYRANEAWWRRVMTGEYREWVARNYGDRAAE